MICIFNTNIYKILLKEGVFNFVSSQEVWVHWILIRAWRQKSQVN